MFNYTMDTYEMKREIVNFSKTISKDVNKSIRKFIMDMQYGIAKSGSCLILEISRSLKEKIELKNTIERLCDNLNNIINDELDNIENNYIDEIKDLFAYEAIALFDDNDEYEVAISHMKVTLPYNKRDYELVFVYGLSEDKSMILLTNREIKSINVLNMMLTIHMGHIGKLVENIDKKLLTIKIIERSQSLRNKVIVWISQIAKGIKEMLKYAHSGIKQWQKIESRDKFRQLQLKI